MADSTQSTRIARGCASLAFVLGAVGLAGWILNNDLLKRVHPSLVAMKVNVALCLMAAGVALFLLGDRSAAGFKRRLAQVLAFLVAVAGILTLSEHLFGVDLGIDQFLFHESIAE